MAPIKYNREELLSFLPPSIEGPKIQGPRAVRKMLFSLEIWNPRRIRSNILLNLQSLNQACRRRQANLKFGLLNSRSAVNKAALIKYSMHDGAFDILVLTETWILSDAPGCIVHSLAPDSFTTVQQTSWFFK